MMSKLARWTLPLALLGLTALPRAQEPGSETPAPSGTPAQEQSPSAEEVAVGRKLLQEQKWEEASAHWKALRDRFPGHEPTLLNYSFAVHSSGKMKEALRLHGEVAKSKNKTIAATGRYNMACAYALLGNREAAIYALYAAAKAGFANHAHLRNDADLKSLHADLRFQKLLIALEDGDPVPTASFRPNTRDVMVLVRQKRFDQAMRAVDILLKRQPGHAMGTYYKGYLLHMQGKLEEALRYHVATAKLKGRIGASAAYNAACVHAQKGRVDAAFEWLDTSVAKGFQDLKVLASDADLKVLHDDERWEKLKSRVKQAGDRK